MDNDTIEFENRTYVNPNVSRDEQMGFIDTLRQTQAENTARINQQTRALGSQIDPMYGGFTGGESDGTGEGQSIFEQRYVTPQTENIVANLKTAAQQTALNQALSNYQNQLKQRYNEAHRNAKIREYNEDKARQTAQDNYLKSLTFNTNNNNTDTTVTVDDAMPSGKGNVTPVGTSESGATSYNYIDPVYGETLTLEYPDGFEAQRIGNYSALDQWPDGTPRVLQSSNSMGNVYTAPDGSQYMYIQADNMPAPSVFRIK